jgi:hypothetical protein
MRMPLLYNTVVLSILLTSAYYLFIRRSFPVSAFLSKYTVVILAGMAAMMLVCYSVTRFHGEFDYELVRILFVELLMVFAMIYAYPLLIDEREADTFEYGIALVCCAYAIQGTVQIAGFLSPAVGDFLISIGPFDSDMVDERLTDIPFRLHVLTGTPFFGLSCGFGIAFILFFRCLFSENQTFIRGYKAYIIFGLLFAGSVFTGRTAWVGLAIALAMSVAMMFVKIPKRFWYNVVKTIVVVPVALFLVYIFLTPAMKKQLKTTVLPFAFEFFYNYEETREFTTFSTEGLIEDHYYSLPYETIMYGKGKFSNMDKTFYGHTDAGYMRSILFGGIFFALCLLIYQALYFLQPLALARESRDKLNYIFFLTLFAALFVFEYKGIVIGVNKTYDATFYLMGMAYLAHVTHIADN